MLRRASFWSSLTVALALSPVIAACSSEAPQAALAVVDDALRRVKLTSLAPADLDARADADAVHMRRLAAAANRLAGAVRAEQTLFARSADVALSADERARALAIFADVLDHCHAYDGLARLHLDAWKLNPIPASPAHTRHFELGYLAYLEKVVLALTLVDQTINKPQFEKLFDEGSPVYGIPAGAYARLKWNVVHVDDVAKTLGAHSYRKVLKGSLSTLREKPEWAFVQDRIDERYAEVRTTLTSKAPKLFGGNSVDIGVDIAHAAWFPVQAETAEWLGDTRVKRVSSMLINEAQVKEAITRSEPGDVIVERRNWYLSNIGLPGFWPHAALWVGSPDELTAWAKDPAVDAAFEGGLVAFLQKSSPKAWQAFSTPDHEGNPRRIIEAVSEGVVFNPAEESIRADYVAAMRPVRGKVDKARAIATAFAYFGRPYDFDFDFYTDESLVCSELVFKSYEPRQEMNGLVLGLEKVVGRMTLGPNSIVRTYDQQRGTKDEQLTFAWFLDGREREGRAVFADEAAFRATWQRPKWDFAQK